MSKIGKSPITILDNTEVQINGQEITIKGKEGSLTITLSKELSVKKDNNLLIVETLGTSKEVKSLHGLYRAVLNNAMQGVNKLWEKRLELVGTGYRVKTQGENLFIEVGFSHPVIFEKVNGVSFVVEGNNKIFIRGVDKELVGQIAHKIKIIKKPDPYKGKGIRYEGEFIKLKPGKKAKTAGA